MTSHNSHVLKEPELLNNIINSSIDGIICIDQDYRYVLWNKSMERISGMPADKVMGKVAFEIFPFLKETTGYESYRRAMGGEVVQDLGCIFDIPESGKKGVFDSTYAPLRNEVGYVVGVVSVVHEVTERLMAEGARAESDLKYRSVTQYAQDAFISCDKDGSILSWNQGAKGLFGYTEEEILGKNITLLIPAQFWENYTKEIKTGLIRDTLIKHRRSSELFGNHKLGTGLPIEVTLSGWRSNGMLFFSVLIRDISVRKHYEALAEDRKNIYDVLLQTQSEMGMGMAILSEDSSRIFYVSQDLCDLYGLTPEEAINIRDPSSFVAPEMKEMSTKRRERREKKKNWENDRYESVHLKKDGTRFFVELSVTRCETNYGPSVIVLTRDITKNKRSEFELIEQKRINNQIMEWAQDVIVTFDLDGTILTLSKSFETMTGWKREEWYGRNISETVVPEDQPNVAKGSEIVLEGRPAGTRVLRSKKKNGDIFYIETMRSPIFREGKVVGMIGIARDVTARINYENALREEELRFRTLAEAAFEAVVMVNNRIIIGANQSFCKMFGYSYEEVIGINIDAFAGDAELAGSEEPHNMGLKRKDGTVFNGEIRGKNVQYKGSPVVVATIREILSS